MATPSERAVELLNGANLAVDAGSKVGVCGGAGGHAGAACAPRPLGSIAA